MRGGRGPLLGPVLNDRLPYRQVCGDNNIILLLPDLS